MAWTQLHYKAIGLYAKQNNLKVALGSFPIARFVDKDGKEIAKNIQHLMIAYQTNKKEETKERKRLKVVEEKSKPWQARSKLD